MNRDPLRVLAEVREEKVDEASAALAGAAAAREATAAARRAAEQARDAHERRIAEAVLGERMALGRGELAAGDLAADNDWQRSVAAEHGALAAHVERVREAEADAVVREGSAHAALVARKAEANAVTAALTRRDAQERRSAEARAEEAAAEAWRPRR